MRSILPILMACFLLIPGLGGLRAQEGEEGGNSAGGSRTAYLLAVSWQPGFCELQPGKAECRSQTPGRADAKQFSLHGLWKMRDSYCGIGGDAINRDKSGRWRDMPALPLSARTAERLRIGMPGSQSGLERHEWIKHGTCSGLDPEAYYARTLDLLDQLNGSAVADLFAARIGKELHAGEIRAAFDSAFGKGASTRVKMRCARDGNRRLITELTIGLSAEATGTVSLAEAIQKAGRTGFGCDGGIVDAAGLQ